MTTHSQQRTIAKSAHCSGTGVHSGKKVNLTLKPAPANHGIRFIRKDLPDNPGIPANFNMVVDTSLATVIGCDGFIVSTIEHLMASFAGLAIDNAIVEIDSYEVPIMDGSAGPFTSLIKTAGIKEQGYPRFFFIVKEPVELEKDGKFVGIYPSRQFKITYTIDFDHPLIKKQSYSTDISEKIFEEEIAAARTFGFIHELEYLKRYGFARGGSLDNVIVIDRYKIINDDGLRYQNEFVRHKILDCLGDISLLGMPILGHLVASKSGHEFNHAFLREFLAQKKSWETSIIDDVADLSFQSKALAI